MINLALTPYNILPGHSPLTKFENAAASVLPGIDYMIKDRVRISNFATTSLITSLNTEMKEEMQGDIDKVGEEVEDVGDNLEVQVELSKTLNSHSEK